MDISCAHEILGYIYEKISIPIESIYWHWQFKRDPNWDLQKDKNKESDINFLSHKASSPSSPLFENRFSIISSIEWQISPTNASLIEDYFPTQNPT